jgi:hypothetical protein
MTISVKLDTPATHGNKTVDTLTFRKPKARDLIAAEAVSKGGGELARTVATLASMADVPYQLMQELEVEDLNRVVAEVGPLLGESPASTAGSTS